MGDAVIETTGLTKRYGRARGIEELDLRVGRGEVFGYLGPNGAGKTTTIRLLLDLIRPTAGSARVLGLDSHRDTIAIRRRIGYVPGDLRLYTSLSGSELVRYFAGLRGGIAQTRVTALAEQLDCDLSREIRTLSSGNRQKLGLIQALMGDPELLILDEPTNGLDPLVQQAFYDLVREAREAGRTVFLSSHVLPEVERVCDRVAILREGRMVAIERIADLRARALRTLDAELETEPPPGVLDGVPGVRDVVIDGNRVRCSVVGDMSAVIRVLAALGTRTLASQEPSLEEAFLAYYGEDATDAA